MSTKIHSKAIIDRSAQLGEGVIVGAYAIVEGGVTLGAGVSVNPLAHIKGNTTIGENTFIGTGAIIGERPQMLGLHEDTGKLFIGKENVIREYVTIHTSTDPEKETVLGNNNYLMGFVHIAHDCIIKNNVVMCNGTLVAGHAHLDDYAFLSGNVVVHQFVRIGKSAMVGGLSRINQDVPPFMMVIGDSRVWGLNLVGLKRRGYRKEEIANIRKAFNILYRKQLTLKSALAELEQIPSESVKELIVFILASKRGICPAKRGGLGEKLFLDYPYSLRTKIPAYFALMSSHRRMHKLAHR
ncbi:MAG: acyl-ACP--UDP-N-acetylglucosamine O-acyltransferase [Candidatus Omnitrophica bacterium]|nr:acyl-ACP--UDP-N-acetylglucosamine O-acyltransferase [Candidatus Omnitrophota bacterium]